MKKKSPPQRKKVFVIYTGGTIGMQPSERGFIPAPGFITQQMKKMPELQQPEMPEYTVHEYQPPIDSSNMTPVLWNRIAHDIVRVYERYDAFIVLHGTDTMAYTASALSFMLKNLSKPVILTGSQLPLSEIRNDAREALITTFLIANQYTIPEVCLYFNHQLFRGNRARKSSAQSFKAFNSENFPPLIAVGTTLMPNQMLWRKPSKKELTLQTINGVVLASVRLFPGFSPAILNAILATPIQGLILETYGTGNIPDNQPELLALLKEASKKNIVIVNCTQCTEGSVAMNQYATGHALYDVGAISAHDMTTEAAITKLYYLFSKKISVNKIKQQMQKNLRGEMSIY